MTRIRPALGTVSAYAPAPLIGVDLDLRDNVNLWGAPPSARRALAEFARESNTTATTLRVFEYPTANGSVLATAIAEQLGIPVESVAVGCGSDDLLDAACRAFASPGGRLAHTDPTFAMVPRFARLSGIEPFAVPMRADGAADVDALVATNAEIVYIASPNNPTGAITPRADLLRLVAAARGVVLIDEAYAEFTDAHDLRCFATDQENLVVFRTFSKAWGLAGLRVGYAIGAPTLIAALSTARGPYKVNAVAERVAATVLREDGAWVREKARAAADARDRIARRLTSKRGTRVARSEGNFAFAAIDESADDVAARFAARGIGVRAFRSLATLGDAIRIGAVPEPALDRLLSAIDEVFV